MFQSKAFWYSQHAFLLGIYAAAAWLCAAGQTSHLLVVLAAVILIAHVLEIPYALRILKSQNPSAGRVALGTLLFGFTWWLPAKRGIFSVR